MKEEDELEKIDTLNNLSITSNVINMPAHINQIIETELDKVTDLHFASLSSNSGSNLSNIHVSFPHVDIKDMMPKLSNHFGNTQELNYNRLPSEFSYTRGIKFKKSNYQIVNPNKQNKNKKKIIELDEVDYLYNKMQNYQRHLIINRTNFIILIVKAMEIIEDYSENEYTKNINKKETVINALNRLILSDLNLNELDQRLFLSSMSNIIELVIICTHHKPILNLNTKILKAKSDDINRANCGQIIFSNIDKLTTIILKKQYNPDKLFTNIPTLTDILMVLVEQYKYLTGIEKKMIVLQALHVFINEKIDYIMEISKDKKQDLICVLESIPLTIDIFIALQKGTFRINKPQPAILKKYTWIKSLLWKKQKPSNFEDEPENNNVTI